MSLKSLRELQYELNKRRSAMMEIDYKKGLKLPTISWTIKEGDLIRRRKEVELNKLYRDAYLAWEGVYENQDFQRFGTAPVRNAYWSIYAAGPYTWDGKIVYKKKKTITTKIRPPEILEHFNHKLLSTPAPTMIFRRFGNLMPPEEALDILVKALLGFPQPMGYKQGNHCAILDDSWTINLRSTNEESGNIMMDSFLKGFAGQAEQLKKAWEEKQVVGVDVSEELKDLFKVYTDAEEHLKSKEKSALESLTHCMKRYLEAQAETLKVTQKLNTLKQKLAAGQPCQGCEGNDEDEDEDEEE